jgi:hypothetical protein
MPPLNGRADQDLHATINIALHGAVIENTLRAKEHARPAFTECIPNDCFRYLLFLMHNIAVTKMHWHCSYRREAL